MFVLGLTGSIATGKSTVLAMFADADVPTYSADAVVHELYQKEAVEIVGAAFPKALVDGKIDRNALAALLVENPERIKQLEALVHPLVRQKMLDFLEKCRAEASEMAVLEIQLLFETASKYPIDAIAVTYCAPDIQQQRALARPGMSVEKLKTILARQMPQSEKQQRADFTIDTGRSLNETRAEIAEIIANCRDRAQATEKDDK